MPGTITPKIEGDGAAKPANGNGPSLSNRPDGRVPKNGR
jgi:hypothetical protein